MSCAISRILPFRKCRRWRVAQISQAAGTLVLWSMIAACTPLTSLEGRNAVELVQTAVSQVLERLRLAHVGFNAYRASLAPAADPLAPANSAKADEANIADPVLHGIIAEASARFGVPERWIHAIMRVESDGATGATSPKGAMGLMQMMPDTYADLRDRFGFSDDAYATRDNILAGSAYIREMYDRYGSPGFIAAYNSGPARYDEYLASGRELPEETLRYVVAVGTALGENFEGSVLGKLPPPGVRTSLRFREPISISPDGEMLEARTGQRVTVTDRLALHSLLSKAIGVSASR